MADGPVDDMDLLVAEVRKTISDNKQFLSKLLDDTEDELKEDEENETPQEDFEEL